VLASGSGGNAAVVEAGGTRVLVDCGLAYRQLQRRMHACELRPETVDAVVLSHEHSDHIQGLPVFRRRHNVPVFATGGTASALEDGVSAVPTLVEGRPLRLGALELTPIATSHDAREPVGFVIAGGGCRVALVTDTGEVSPAMAEMITGCHALLLETNHDPDLLRYGSYPWPLKRRIASSTGHLSNTQAQKAVEHLCHPGLSVVVGMHLSRENNRPELVRNELGRVVLGAGVRVEVADQERPLVLDVGGPGTARGQLRLFDDGGDGRTAAGAGRRG
jgi:phosphoribosyl 1,2-cyclic phosphodiesterase